ncbi:MAG: hypothetical protein ACRD19_03095, partial [Terriglobia bacterium]
GSACWVFLTRRAAAPAPRIAAFVLAPGVERGAAIRTLRIPPDAGLVRLELELPAGDRRARFSAVLSNAAGKNVWKADGIERGHYGLSLSIPVADFKPGGFRLELEGNPPQAYYFAVRP